MVAAAVGRGFGDVDVELAISAASRGLARPAAAV
jgi:hypothetical protein